MKTSRMRNRPKQTNKKVSLEETDNTGSKTERHHHHHHHEQNNEKYQ